MANFASENHSFPIMDNNFASCDRQNWIFFDLDDTLWDFEGNSMRSLHHAYNSFPISREKFSSFDDFSNVYHIHNSRLWKELSEGKVSTEFLRTERWRATLFPEVSTEDPPGICEIINNAYLSKLSSLPHVVKGAEEILAKLTKENLVAVISNGFTDTQYEKLHNSGLWRFITRVIISDETGIQKPNKGIFDYAIEETGATGFPVMIGDNPDTDIIGALNAGWKAIWFNPGCKDFPYSKDTLVDMGIDPNLYLGEAKDLKEVERLLAERNSVK